MPEPNRGRTQNLGAPKPDSHLGTFATKPKTGIPCGHPELQELLPALFAGSLAKTGRQVERRAAPSALSTLIGRSLFSS